MFSASAFPRRPAASRSFAAFAVCGALLGALACGGQAPADLPEISPGAKPAPPNSSTSGEAPAARVVSLAPNLTEMMFALGLQDRLVGVTQYCRYPPEAQAKPKVGALVNMNYERLLELRPDLVLLLPSHSKVAEDLARLEIPFMTVRTESIADVFAALETLGGRFGRADEASALVARLKAGLAALAAAEAPAARPRVLFVIGRNPGTLQQIYAVGSGNYASELLAAVGAENVLASTASPWPVVSKESILQLDPDIIIDGSLYSGEAPAPADPALLKVWDQLPALKAVKNGRVLALPDEHLLLPGVGAIEKAGLLRDLIFSAEEAR